MKVKMKKKTKILISIAAVLTVVFLVCVFAGKAILFNDKMNVVNYFSVRAYKGDRITVNMHITVDGKPAKVISDEENYRLSYKDGCTTLKALANSYDTYEYSLRIKNGSSFIPLNITAHHWNWWEITQSDLFIDVDTVAKTFTVSENYKYTAEQPYYHIKYVSEPKETFEDIDSINILVGPKG